MRRDMGVGLKGRSGGRGLVLVGGIRGCGWGGKGTGSGEELRETGYGRGFGASKAAQECIMLRFYGVKIGARDGQPPAMADGGGSIDSRRLAGIYADIEIF